jgi:hypothetical protein
MTEIDKGSIEPKLSQDSGKEINRKPYCLFISGISGTYAGIRGIKEGLERQYGAGNVKEFNSVVSSDPQNPRRFEQMADIIQERAKSGLDIVAHSLGAAELRKAIVILNKRDNNFFNNKENAENLQIVLVSPAGFSKDFKSVMHYVGRTFKYLREQGNLPIISKSNTLLRGIDALAAFPPEGVSPEDLALALRAAMPKISQYKEYVKAVPLGEEEGYVSNLTIDKQKEVEEYGKKISSAIETKDYVVLRDLVKKYGQFLKEPLEQIFAGNYEKAKAQIVEATTSTMGGYVGMLSTLIDAYGGKPMRELAKLIGKVPILILIPEYDIFMTLKEAIDSFAGTNKAPGVEIAEGAAHAYLALRNRRFAETVRNVGKNENI